MKKLFIIACLTLLTIGAQAQYAKSIRLTADDGTDVILNLSRSLVISFDNENLIASDGEQTLSVSLDKVKMEYSTENNSVGIKLTELPDHYVKDGTVVFQGLKAGETVRVFTIGGQQIQNLSPDGNSKSVSVILSTLPKGISIIQVGKYSMKYINR